MALKFTNNATSVLTSSFNIGATSLTVTAGHGTRFPTLAAGDFFYATLEDGANNIEIVKVTGRLNDTFTSVTRAQGGTTERNWVAGDAVELRLTAEALNTFSNLSVDQTWTSNQTFNGDVSAAAVVKAEPKTDGGVSLGSALKRWLNVYLSGVVRWGSGSNTVSLGAQVATAARNVVLPNASGTVALLESPEFTGTPKAPTAVAGTNTTQVASTAFLRQEVLGRRSIWVPSFGMQNSFNSMPSASTYASDYTTNQMRGFSFSDSTDATVWFQLVFPKAWDLGAIRFRPYWVSPSVLAGSAVWALAAGAFGSGDAPQSLGAAVSVVSPTAGLNLMNTTAESADVTVSGAPEQHDMVAFKMTRKGTDAADTLPSFANLIGVMIYYTVSALKDN